jgi:flagellar hook-length control protein FliK
MRTDPPAPTLTFATPVDSPQFAGALGVQVSVLARGGVQHAELHLNPAEMGPVSIRIELDGTDAQVQFGADLAETRRAIENGLPELASALRDAGFTLSGGGVSQHASQRGGADGEGDGATSHLARAADLHADSDASGTGAPRDVRHVAAGGVDVYA